MRITLFFDQYGCVEYYKVIFLVTLNTYANIYIYIYAAPISCGLIYFVFLLCKSTEIFHVLILMLVPFQPFSLIT